ncbi:glutamine synthetase III [Peptoniphilus raoultii]|uniref:glutamine synthetase III n=1 Tax=Peptoniphilus raoultii TaxID=1776387 RepID=UPI0008DA3FF7|nr:glutamine synthetase III [Peptoniphilus raoultii]
MKVMENFGIKVFNKEKMKEKLPYPIYLKWKDALRVEKDLDSESADAIAHAMKDWAINNGATHFAHWFQPLNGQTAKKYVAFLDRTADAEPIERFSGKELIKGEPDASSFPSGGMRSTFEARGYTYWDLTANSFIIDNVFYIPTIFMSYYGEKLDKRGPLLDSVNALSNVGRDLVNLFSEEHAYRMRVKIGLEQEFFLVDKDLYDKRSDLKNVGRTLVGCSSPKSQEYIDRYFGQIPKRVEEFFREVDKKLWELGIYSKTEHNENAPLQFELAILFENANVAIDDNLLCMNIIKETALKYNMVCLLHEKPFKGVNGSGKHNNYSITTNFGLNCFEPGPDPYNNNIFLLFTAAVIELCYKNQNLLYISSSSPSNDHRLGGLEAPPSIISVFLGRDLEELFMAIKEGRTYTKDLGGKFKGYSLKDIPKDSSDRNRTSAVSFTGNKFEFRMLGSSKNASDLNIVINCGLAENLKAMEKRLSPFKDDKEKLRKEVLEIVKEVMENYGGSVYSGDNYSEEWKKEAKKRGLKNYKNYLEALLAAKNLKQIDIFLNNGVFTKKELKASYEISLNEVISYNLLETRTLLSMLSKDLIPSLRKELNDTKEILKFKENEGLVKIYDTINSGLEKLILSYFELKELYLHAENISNGEEKAQFIQNNIVNKLEELRNISDELEMFISRNNLYLPTYEDMFNSLD